MSDADCLTGICDDGVCASTGDTRLFSCGNETETCSGLLSQAMAMIVTGYLLQVAVDEAWRTAWIWGHVVTSIAFSVAFVLHLLVRISVPDAPPGAQT